MSAYIIDLSHILSFFPELKEHHGWYKMDYSNIFDLALEPIKNRDAMPRIDCTKVTVEEFIENYEKPYKPVVVTRFQDVWKANVKWTKEVIH